MEQHHEVESCARTYTTNESGNYFSEPFLTATFYNTDPTNFATMDLNGVVQLPPRTAIQFNCNTGGRNITNITITPTTNNSVIVFWTKYKGLKWQNR